MKNRIELHAKTKYSMDHESTLDIKELILKCASNGEKGVAIVDKDSVISFYKAERILKELNIKDFKLVYGVEVNSFYKDNNFRVVVLLKNKNGISKLFRMLSPYYTNNRISLEELMLNRKDLLIGLIYEDNNYDSDILECFDYVEVDNKVSRDIISFLKEKTLVIYSNRINALSSDEVLSKSILYNKLNIKSKVVNRGYQNTKEVLKEINDLEIVIDNSNKLFDMIENFELVEDKIYMLNNDSFDVDLLVNIKLNEKYGNDVPQVIRKRVDEELKLINEYNYDGFINLYKKIIDKCRDKQEEFVIYDYISYLYVAYLLDITHFDPIKFDLNYDFFFSNNPSISIKVSENFNRELLKYIKEELNVNMVRCKSLMKFNKNMIAKEINKYENDNNFELTLKEKLTVDKYLNEYPINNQILTPKQLILPSGFNLFEISPREIIKDGINYHRFMSIDYKDVQDKFITLEIFSDDKMTYLNELKDMTKDRILNCNYKDKKIIKNKDFKNFVDIYKNDLVLDDLYEDLINNNVDFVEVFSIINEIKKDKKVSKNTKMIFEKNNIEIKNNHNVNYICRGILNEITRLEYELLYFKEYYPLEYYYVFLKDCPFNELIEVIKNGYDAVKSKLKDYQEYRYEYKYLNLVKELYESNITFLVEDRFIIEDYCFELDKEEEKIVLITNKSNNEINRYLSNDLSVIGTRPVNGKMPYISKILFKLIRMNKNITLFGLDGPINFYLEYLLNEITGIDRKVIRQYLNPCSCYKDNVLEIDEECYMNGIKYLLYHDLSIKDYHNIKDSIIDEKKTMLDKLIYMIESSESKIIIIDRIESIEGNIEDTLVRLKEVAVAKNINIILFTNLKRKYEEDLRKDISSFENEKLLIKYINYINILDGEDLYLVKGN